MAKSATSVAVCNQANIAAHNNRIVKQNTKKNYFFYLTHHKKGNMSFTSGLMVIQA